jgi:tetratricopeptide (TPR) repeat protein
VRRLLARENQSGAESDLPSRLIASLAAAELIHPAKINGTLTYSDQDLRNLRIAGALWSAKIPMGKMVVALGRVIEALAAEPTHGEQQLESAARQHRLPFIVDTRKPNSTMLRRRAAAEQARLVADDHFESALALEDSDVAAARASYLAALDAHSEHLEARINLGRLLHLSGELEQAEQVYRTAKQASALLSFNLGILLEDLNREEEAILSYQEALALDPGMHDAHFNLSRLHERAERPREALRHLLTYRRYVKDIED